MSVLIEVFRAGKSAETESRLAQGWGGRKSATGQVVSFWSG